MNLPSNYIALIAIVAMPLCACTPSSQRAGNRAEGGPTIVPAGGAGSADDAAPEWTRKAVKNPEAVSLLGKDLFAPELPADIRAQREEDLYKAQTAYDTDLHDENAIIWLGRRLAYLGRYREAIDAFSNGLAIMPDSFRLLRHRGHRYITLREFDKAIADLSQAAKLIDGLDDETEPDGQPNASGIPTSTTHTNIFYHLGLAHYLKGEWQRAADAYEDCYAASTNDDMRIAAAYWLYLANLRAGNAETAAATLKLASADMQIIENDSYWKLLLVFKGELDEDTLQAGDGVGGDRTIDLATIGYGLGVRDLMRGNEANARKRFEDIIANTNWAAFGHIAAEAELARLRH